ncbi:type II secretion system protein [Pseudomarimonas arenosa]|uniref:Type II secretion system protein n=1 Tax=Pseudomarimonas arenosa TaxID=2774145 RepID=A0AAW3ZIV8_9GAMM|nr:type II secretion system protein [Pseudomarimonas arenosa]MBD8526005.1 type II secretion system protein [Pseudomarimonas arenosa]
MSATRTSTAGFTLLEMAVTLAIVSILLGGLLLTLGAQQDLARDRETRILLTQARDALYGFAMQNGRLPCPADVGTASTGVERPATAAGCGGGGVHGVLPWATLGLPEGDDWARRFTYSVTPAFARQVPALPARSAFTLTDVGNISIRRRGGTEILIDNAPAIIVSHGPNGWGARSVGGGTITNSSDPDEQENSDADFVFRDDLRAEDYDDMVEWVVPAILMNRMVQAGRLP